MTDSSSNQVKECRICFFTEDDNPDMQFINPCACNGTSKWVHVECLNRWRASNQNPTSSNICSECRTEYNIIVNHNQHETMIYGRTFIQNIFYTLNGLSIGISMFVYLIDDTTDYALTNFLILNANTDMFDNNYQNFDNAVYYYNVGGYLMINIFYIRFIINILSTVIHKNRYVKKIWKNIINILLANQLFFPLLQMTVSIKTLKVFTFLFTLTIFILIYATKILLEKSNIILREINLTININDTILPYSQNIIIGDGYDADSDSSIEIELFPEFDEDINDNESALLVDNQGE